MPSPTPGESRQDFMDRCIPMVIDDGSAEDPEQAAAMCGTMFDDEGKSIAYARFTIEKGMHEDEDERTFEGIATTITADRDGDIVEPGGASFALPMPLLWQHDRFSPVGEITHAKQTKDGIRIKGRIAKADYPPGLKNRLDEAWQSIKLKLVKGLSIGFRPLEHSFMEESGGIHFLKWDWYELSLVTIPANVQATITAIKQYDAKRAPTSHKRSCVSYLSHKPKLAVAKSLKTGNTTMTQTVSEQIKSFESSLAAKQEAMKGIMAKAGDEGRTLDATEQAEFDGYQEEIESISQHIKRLRMVESMTIEKAVPAAGGSAGDGAKSRGGVNVSKTAEQLEKGIEFVRFAMALGAAKGNLGDALEYAKSHYPRTSRIHNALAYARKFGNSTSPFAVAKAAVAGGTTTDSTWAGPLVEYNQFAGDFVDFLRPMTIIGKFGVGGIPSLRRVPFNIHIREQTSGGAAYWVGQGQPKPLTAFDFIDVYLGFSKLATIAVITEELMRFSNPAAEALVRDQLARALVDKLDSDFINPDVAAVANVSPASITNAATPITSAGTDADAVRADIEAAISQFIVANISLATGVWIMSMQTALTLSLMRNALGQREFPDITMMGGMLEGLPVIASEYVGTTSSNGQYMALVNASDVWLADDGQVTVDMSREASLQMLDNPTNNAATGTATTLVSMFQTNSVALRAERYVNWQLRRAAAVALIDQINYDAGNSGV